MKQAVSQRVTLRIWSGCWFPERGRETSTQWRPFMSPMPSSTAVTGG